MKKVKAVLVLATAMIAMVVVTAPASAMQTIVTKVDKNTDGTKSLSRSAPSS